MKKYKDNDRTFCVTRKTNECNKDVAVIVFSIKVLSVTQHI